MPGDSVAPRLVVDAHGRIISADDDAMALLGPVSGRALCSVGAGTADTAGITSFLATVVKHGAAQARLTLRGRNHGRVQAQLIATHSGGETSVVVIDETERVQAEEHLAASQRRLLSLVRNAADIVFTTSSDGSLTSVTSALPSRLGWDVEDVVGRFGLSFVHEDDRPAADAAWIAVSARRSVQEQLDARLVHKDGTQSWARIVVSDLRGDPDVGCVVGNVTDITEQKLSDARRRHAENRFRTRFEQSLLPQSMLSVDGIFEAVNSAFCLLVGRPEDELVGANASIIIHPDDPGDETSHIEAMRARGLDWVQEDRVLRDAQGRPIPVRVDVTLLRDENDEPTGCAAVLQDLRPLRDSEQARDQLQLFFDAIAERSRDFVTVHDVEGRSIYASPAGRRMFGPTYNMPVQKQAMAVHPDDLAIAAEAWEYVQTHSDSSTWRTRVQGVDGQWLWIEQTATNLLDTDVGGIVSSIRDVSAEVAIQQALRTSEARYRAMAETAEEGIVVISPAGEVTYANARLSAIMGIPLENMIGREVWSVLEGESRSAVTERVKGRRARGSERYEVTYCHPDGLWRTLLVAASPMPDVDDQPQGSLAMISDITEIRRGENELRRAAQHDHLTGLPNRTTVMKHLESLSIAEETGTAVLFVDLDHFKDVNDGRGHTAGDDVLVQVGLRLMASVESPDVVARFGGDEFVVVLQDTDEQAAKELATQLLESLSAPYSIGHHTVRIGATIGIAMSPATSAEDIVRFADTAMYAAKAGGRGRIRVFDRALAQDAEDRYVLGGELLAALSTDELEMNYQPVIDVATGEVVGVEALARWNHPTRGSIPPSRFVALAEANASANDLDRWVIKRALRDVSELKADLTMPDDAYVSINLSGQTLSNPGLGSYIVDSVAEVGLDPGVVMLEITESAIMADKDTAVQVLHRLRDHGFAIAIDDFGTGYSSMVYLRDLPVTVLKIDRGFVRGIPDDPHSLAIVTSLIDIGRSLDLTVVAEGVESHAHLDALRERGCGLAQGWWWSPALSVHDIRSSRILTDRFAAEDVWPGRR